MKLAAVELELWLLLEWEELLVKLATVLLELPVPARTVLLELLWLLDDVSLATVLLELELLDWLLRLELLVSLATVELELLD